MADEQKVKDAAETAEQMTIETAAGAETQPEEREGVVTFQKPYVFEGKDYTEVDLTGIKKMTIGDAIKLQSDLMETEPSVQGTLTEKTTAFARAVATQATGQPVEFFKLMPRGKFKLVQREVIQAIAPGRNLADGDDEDRDDHILKLKQPYTFEGTEYKEIDLNGLANLTSMNESEAENRMTRAGVSYTDATWNYLYICILASMATGQPEKFFTGLPIGELLKLRLEVNSSDFFE